MKQFDEFTWAYIECALWSSCDANQGDEPLDANYDSSDLAPETLAEMLEDCADFQKSFGSLVPPGDDAQAGYDFWLTRNGHGAGFWDGDWARSMPPDHWAARQYKTVGDFLTAMSKPYGEVDLYVGDDGLIYC